MIEEKFIEISESVNGTYTNKTEIFKGYQWSSLPVTIHELKFEHKGHLVKLRYDFGNSYLGTLFCELKLKRNFPDFKISRKNHFTMLFKKNKNAWEIECKDESVQHTLMNLIFTTGIEELSNSVAFEPDIKGKNKNGHYTLHTNYYLGFENKEESILLLINFYKKLIDNIER